jgi:cupin superfamily acireductone dioxygenase involved in methionine salvage
MSLPFVENLKDGFHIRTFSSNLTEMELKWHFDEEDRIVLCENDTDWMFQMDNELPIKIKKNTPIFIPEGTYHRIIKGTGDLVVKVKMLKLIFPNKTTQMS